MLPGTGSVIVQPQSHITPTDIMPTHMTSQHLETDHQPHQTSMFIAGTLIYNVHACVCAQGRPQA